MPWNRTPGIQESHRQPHGPWSSGLLPEFLAFRSDLTQCKPVSREIYTVSSEAGSRRRILDATLVCARARSDFSMAEVAAGAGLSRQAVYLHFPDRAALLATLRAELNLPDGPELVEQAPSARAALSSVLTRLAESYARLWPVLRASGSSDTPSRLSLCQALVARFRNEGALAPHLSPATAADILFSLTSPALWHELVQTRGWDAARYRSHIGFLTVSALTK
jgi:AcrR family transcriptional regulator